MAGHSKLHPFLKSYDELSRSVKRMETYLAVYGDGMHQEEKEAVQSVIEHLTAAINHIPEQYQVSRWEQYKKEK
jgi:hypothetical protein